MSVTSSVRLSKEAHGLVASYSDKTGIPISRVLDDIVADWMKTVGAVRLEAFERHQEQLKELARMESDRIIPFRIDAYTEPITINMD